MQYLEVKHLRLDSSVALDRNYCGVKLTTGDILCQLQNDPECRPALPLYSCGRQGPRALAREISASWKEQGLPCGADESQAEDYINTFFGTYSSILPYFKEEYGRLTEPKVSERVLKNPVTGRIRRFPKSDSDKLMREMKATLLQQVESHILKASLVKLREEIRRRGVDGRIVACIHDSIWVEAAAEEKSEVREIMETVMTTAMSLTVPLSVDFEE